MAKLLKLRRGTTSQHGSFTGAEGEVTVDTDKETLVVHDGSTAGGHAVAAEDMANVSSASIVGRLGTGSVVKAKLEADIIDGTKLADDAVNSEHIAAGAVDLEHMSTESVDEDNLKISNAGSNGHFLQKQSGNAGGLTWAAVDLSTYAPLAAPALTGNATAVNLTLSGNLTVNGTTTTVATTNTTVTDNLLELNSGASSNANDAGILIERGSTGDNAIIAWDESADRFTLGTTTSTNTATGNISVSTGTLAANIVGNVTGNTSGSSGSCTGTALVATSVTVTDESSDTTCFPLFADGATGNLSVRSGTNLTFNSSTGELEADIVKDSKGDLRLIPANVQSSSYNIATSDSGKVIYASGTVNVTQFMTAGMAVTIINNTSGDITIAKLNGYTYWTQDGSNASRTLASRGMATIWWYDWNTAYISGAGLS